MQQLSRHTSGMRAGPSCKPAAVRASVPSLNSRALPKPAPFSSPCPTPTPSFTLAPAPSTRPSTRVAAAAEPASAPSAKESAPQAQQQPSGPKEWFAVVANVEFMFNDPQNESLAEQLRERVRYFREIKRPIDFYIVPEPKWLDQKYPEQAKLVARPCVAIVSSDKTWITFMKLRLDRVLRFDMGPIPEEEALAVGGKVPELKPKEKWTAPYPGYTPGWWDRFIPGSPNQVSLEKN